MDDDALQDELVGTLHRHLLDSSAGAGNDIASDARSVVDTHAGALHSDRRAQLTDALLRRATGFGPLEPLLADPLVDEVMVVGCRPIWVERRGRIEQTAVSFPSEAALREVADRILAPLGRRVDASQPICDARLADGSRVNITIPPLAVDGTTVTIRRFRAGGHTIAGLQESGAWTPEIAGLLTGAVAARRTVIVCGSTGSGKTTVLGALSAAIPREERIVTIEDAAELRLDLPHVVRLESRPANVEGDGAVSIRDLVRNAMRMRPDRVLVGEVRGGEALDLLIALSSGHAGALSTLHAGSPAEALRRLELLAMLGGIELPLSAVRELVRGSVDLIALQQRLPDGRRILAEVAEVGEADRKPRTLSRHPEAPDA